MSGFSDEGMAPLGNFSSDAMIQTVLLNNIPENKTLLQNNIEQQQRDFTVVTNITGKKTDLIQVQSLHLQERKQFASAQPSPACKPNLRLALPGWKWDNVTKFKRIYFYHARKA